LADASILTACLSNLVTNAVDACTWDPDESKEHEIVVAVEPAADGGVVFEVSDNGTGIPESHQSKVLKGPFTTKGIRGTGLGLLLTRKAVEQHGGRITYRTTPGRGTCFRIQIPAGNGRRESPLTR